MDAAFALALTFGPLALGFPVRWKWFVWLSCWALTVVLFLPDYFPVLRTFPRKSKILVLLGAIVTFVVIFRPIESTEWKREQADLLEGDLFGGTFEPQTNCMAVPVQIGSAGTVLMMIPPKAGQQMPPYFAPFPDAQFLVACGKRGILISTTVRNRQGSMVVNVERNHWTVYRPYFSDKNYTKTAFEVKDDAGHVVLQLRLAPGDKKDFARLQVQGEWWNDEYRGLRIVFTGQGGGEVIPLSIQNQHNDALIQPIFKYPSRDFWGVFAN